MTFLDLSGVIFLGIVSFGILWFGWYKGFFHWNPRNNLWNGSILLKQTIIPFLIYFGICYALAPLLIFSLKSTLEPGVAFASWLNFIVTGLTLLALLLYWRSLPEKIRTNIFHNDQLLPNYREDFAIAFYAWCLAFPLVLFASQFLEAFVYYAFHVIQLPDQIAVQFVKMTFSHPLYFFLAILTVVFIAPIVEETLFRGFLQSFIRKYLGSRQAILITAICFAFFHFSPDQGLGNIPIIGSLFSLALFLGFIYEKQGSLFASISLHSMFNAISILNLYFLGGIPSPL